MLPVSEAEQVTPNAAGGIAHFMKGGVPRCRANRSARLARVDPGTSGCLRRADQGSIEGDLPNLLLLDTIILGLGAKSLLLLKDTLRVGRPAILSL